MTAESPLVFPWLQVPMRVTSPYGLRKQADGQMHFHNGTDFGCPVGDPLYTSFDGGLVMSVVDTELGGKQVDVYYPGPAVCFKYLHLDKVLVLEGQVVKIGQHIANSGNTGRKTTGPHLHLSVVPKASMPLGYHRRMMDPRKHYLDPEQYLSHLIDPTLHAFLGHSEEQP